MIFRAGHTLLLLVIAISAGNEVKAQSLNPNYNFKHLNVQNGLAQNIVFHFLHDSRGYMWIGTHNGLTLYDGIKTINFLNKDGDSTTISGRFITSLLEDSVQQVWIGNEKGINRYNRHDNSFSHFPIDRPDGKKDTTYCVLLGFTTATDLWFLETETRSVRSLNTKTKRTSFLSELNTTNAVFYKNPASQTFHVWSTYDKGTIHQVFSGNKLIKQQTFFTEKNTAGQPVLEVSHIVQQNDSTVWLSTNKGLVKLNPVVNSYIFCNSWQNKTINEIRYAALSPKGQLWLGSGPAGIYTFDITTNQFIDNFRFDKSDPFSICSDNIVCLYFDKVGNAWCGSYGNGASYTNIENVFFNKHISKNDTEPSENDLKVDWTGYDHQKNLWCSFANIPGFMVLDTNLNFKKRVYPLLDKGTRFNGYINRQLFDKDSNEIWCGTNKGLMLFDTRTNHARFIKYPLLSEERMGSIWINDLIWIKDGSIIFSTFWGLYRVTIEANKIAVKPFSELNKENFLGFRRLFQDNDGFVYVKSTSHVLYILKPDVHKGDYELAKKIDFPSDINHFFYDKEKKITLIATVGGLYSINTKDFQLQKKELNNLLPFSTISSVFKKGDRLWLFGEKGLYVFDEATNSGKTFTVEDGLPSNEFSPSTLIFGPDHRCIAGTSNGLVSFFPDRQPKSILHPRIQLTGIYVNDVLHTSSPNSNELKKISLSPRENTFSFDFSAIAFQHLSDYIFEYKLEGYDDNWIKGGNARYTRYSKIPPGQYVFNLRAIDPQGNISPHSKTLDVEIAYAFWQTLSFKIAVAILLLVAGWLAVKWFFNQRIRKQKREFEKLQAIEKERTRIATDMHDDLGAGLSRIKFLSQSLSNKDPNDKSIKSGLEKITGYSDEMTEKMGEIVWSLNEKNDTLADLVAYSRSYAIEYLANHDIACKANTPLGLPETFIAGEIRGNIFLSVKECLHNIVKHAGATCVNFSVELSDTIKITIHDNGKGIDWNNQRAFSNGIQNIQRRMKDVKGEVKFSNEQGTKVVLIIPL